MSKGRVCVTGGLGFIGSHTVEELVRQGYEVTVLDDGSTGAIKNLSGVKELDIRIGDVRDIDMVRKALVGVDYVIHLAAMVSVPDAQKYPYTCMEINEQGTWNILKVAEELGIKRVVFASSAAVYGDAELAIEKIVTPQPIGIYGMSKYMAEIYCQAPKNKQRVQVLRYFNVYGARQKPGAVISSFVDNILSGNKIRIDGDGHQTRSFVYVKDVARVNVAALELEKTTGPINIAHSSMSVKHVAGMIFKMLDVEDPDGEWIERGPSRAGDIWRSIANTARQEEFFPGLVNTSLPEGLEETLIDEKKRRS